MEIKIWEKNEMPNEFLFNGLSFIIRRFKEDWGVTRKEITKDIIKERVNIVLIENKKIIGWVGLEDNGELDNGCIEIGYKGSDLLGYLIQHALNNYDCNFFAYVPFEKYGSAIACHKASNGKISITDEIEIRHYDEKDVSLVKILFTDNANITRKELISKLNSLKGVIS